MPEIECTECGWYGFVCDLLCSDEDEQSGKPTNEIDFDICPDCESVKSCEDYEE